MKPYTLTLFLLLAGLGLRAQLQRGDWLIPFAERVTFDPVPTPAGMAGQLSRIRTYPGDATAIYLTPAATYLFRDRWGVGAELTALFVAGGGAAGGVIFQPYLRRYFINRSAWQLYGNLGGRITYSSDDGTDGGIAAAVGLHLPLDPDLLFTSALSALYNGDRVTPTLSLGLTLRVGGTGGSEQNLTPLGRGTLLLGASSFALTQGRTFWAYEADFATHYFLLDRLALGARIRGSGYRGRNSVSGEFSDSRFTPGLALRYYFRTQRPLGWFAEGGVDFPEEYTSPYVLAGVSYAVRPRILLEYGLMVQDAHTTVAIGQQAGLRIVVGRN